jgi:hypothetical protein
MSYSGKIMFFINEEAGSSAHWTFNGWVEHTEGGKEDKGGLMLREHLGFNHGENAVRSQA